MKGWVIHDHRELAPLLVGYAAVVQVTRGIRGMAELNEGPGSSAGHRAVLIKAANALLEVQHRTRDSLMPPEKPFTPFVVRIERAGVTIPGEILIETPRDAGRPCLNLSTSLRIRRREALPEASRIGGGDRERTMAAF